MKPQKLRWAATCVAACWFSWLPAAAWGDVLPPEPTTTWAKGQAPSGRSIAIAGGCLSAAVIAAGLLAAKLLTLRSAVAKAAVAAGSLLLAVAIAAAAFWFYRQADKDRQAWQQYEHAVKNRRWTPPPDFRGFPAPESAPAAAASSPPDTGERDKP